MTSDDKSLQELKDIYKKEYGVEISDEKARDIEHRMDAFANIIIDQILLERKRKKRLEKEPDGFCLNEPESQYACRICNQYIPGVKAWWDLNGIKCFDCQRNIKNGVIPVEICKDDSLFIQQWQLTAYFSLRANTIRKLRQEGILNGIDLKTELGEIYYTIYLVKDNKKFLETYPEKPKYKIKYSVDP